MRTIDADALKKEVENLVVGGAKGLKDYYENGSKSDENAWIGGVYDAWELIDNAPSVEIPTELCKGCRFLKDCETCEEKLRPQGEWVSVSERLPNDRDWYLGLFKEPDTDFIGIPYICDYVGEVTKGTTNEGWILRHCTDVDNASDYFRNLICVAWQPLPEQYKKGGAE